MRLLLDENLPHQVRLELPGHAVVTNDRGLESQQDLTALPVAVIVVQAPANTVEAIRLAYPALLAALTSLRPREFVKVSAP